jgi:hypothetical protein
MNQAVPQFAAGAAQAAPESTTAKRKKSPMRWAPAAVAWAFGLQYVFTLDPEHARLYLIVTVFLLVVYNVSRRRRREGEKSAYAMCNEDGERIDGDMSLANFGLKDVSAGAKKRPAAAAAGPDASPGSIPDSTAVLGVHPLSTLGRYERQLLYPCFGGDAVNFRRYLDELAAPTSKHKLHAKCPCKSGKRFSGCCSELQIFLRQSKFGQ